MTPLTVTLTLSPGQTLETALLLFQQHPISCLPVVNPQGHLQGIVTRDMLTHHLRQPLAPTADPVNLTSVLLAMQQQIDRQNQELGQMVQQLQTAHAELEHCVINRTQELTQAEEQFRVLATHAPVGIFQSDAMGDCVFVNHRWLELTGLSLAQAMGQGWKQAIHPEDRERVFHEWDAAFQAKQEFRSEYRFQTPQGQVYWVIGNATAFQDEAGRVTGYLGTVTDISDRVQAEIDRQQAKAAFQQSETKFRYFAENSHAVIWIAQPTSLENLYISPAYERVWGRSRQTLIDRPDSWLDAIHPDDRERVRLKLEQQRQGQYSDAEYRIVRPDGSIRWIWDWGFPIRNDTGQVESFGGIAEDITERKESELQLREMSVALSNAVEGISRLDEQGCYLMVNEAYASTVGYRPEEMVGMNWQKTVHPEDLGMLVAAYEQMLQTGKVELEARGVRRDGSVFDKQLFMISAYDEQQRFTGHHCFMKNISEKKRLEADRQRAEAELKQSEQKLRAIFDSTFQFTGVLTPEGLIIDCNQAALDVIEVDRVEVIGQPFWEMLWWTDYPEQQEKLKEAIAQAAQGEFIRFESKHIWADGTQALVDFSIKPVLDDQGQVVMLLPEGRDITEKKQLEAQFLRAQRLESIGTLASGIAHDLNNILTPILGVAQLLPRKLPPVDPTTQRLLEILEINARRGGDLVKQVLAFARGEESQRTPLQAGHLLIEIGKIAQQTFPKSIQVKIQVSTRDLWLVQADATQLHQVIMNLCINARDAMPQGGTLTIAAENCTLDESFARLHLDAQVGAYFKMSIADTGIGIPPDVFDRIFDPFFTTKSPGQGTGLGLSTVLTIVKNHGGFLDIITAVDKGTQFQIYLPALEQGEELQIEPLAFQEGHQDLILVVDDESAIRQTVKAVLEIHGYQVLVAEDGIEAIALYAQHRREISLVLLDLVMPSFDGFRLIDTLTQLDPQVQIIAMSGLEAYQEQLSSCDQVQAFLAKPFTAQDLLTAIAGIVERSPLPQIGISP
jgi:PAS domain S-box-containing protein